MIITIIHINIYYKYKTLTSDVKVKFSELTHTEPREPDARFGNDCCKTSRKVLTNQYPVTL